MKHKYIITIAAAAMTISMSFSALAGVVGGGYNGSAATTNINTVTNANTNGKTFTAPGWLWVGPYCYYFTEETHWQYPTATAKEKVPYNASILFKNGVTPDGYQVDAEGRWIVDGVVQVNPEFGNVRLGMADQYAGKSGNDLWVTMRDKLESIWKEMYPHTGYSAFSKSNENFIEGNAAGRNSGAYGAHFTATFSNGEINIIYPNEWYHQSWIPDASQDKASYANRAIDIERTLKAALGDNVGQELFNYMRSVADTNVEMNYKPVYDENGNSVFEKILMKKDGTAWEVDDAGNIIKARPELNGGINSEEYILPRYKNELVMASYSAGLEKLDWSSWQNRTTDYGKTFSVIGNGRQIVIYP